MDGSEDLQSLLQALHAEALRVGDSPQRADQLASKLPLVRASGGYASLSEDVQHRVDDALAAVERVLRRDDDGREAARHLQSALSLIRPRQQRPSPFLDEE